MSKRVSNKKGRGRKSPARSTKTSARRQRKLHAIRESVERERFARIFQEELSNG